MTPEKRKLLTDLNNTSFGIALREFLVEEKEKIGDIRLAKNWEEVQGRQHALDLIDKLFSFMENKPEMKKGINQYY